MGPGLTLTPLLSGGEGGGHHRGQAALLTLALLAPSNPAE